MLRNVCIFVIGIGLLLPSIGQAVGGNVDEVKSTISSYRNKLRSNSFLTRQRPVIEYLTSDRELFRASSLIMQLHRAEQWKNLWVAKDKADEVYPHSSTGAQAKTHHHLVRRTLAQRSEQNLARLVHRHNAQIAQMLDKAVDATGATGRFAYAASSLAMLIEFVAEHPEMPLNPLSIVDGTKADPIYFVAPDLIHSLE